MTDVFISYSRKDKAFVQVLNQALADSKYDAWVDWENIPLTADWWEEIKAGIEGADTFIFVISPDSIESKVCGQEIDHAVENNKRLLPIVYREGFDMSLVRPALGKHNWLFFKEENDFDQAFSSLVETLNTDLSHVKVHTRLLVRALEWEKKHRNDDFLLRGSDLEDAENWLSEATATLHEPLPTEQHKNYITKSREVEDARQRLVSAGEKAKQLVRIGVGVLAGTIVIATTIGIFTQRNVLRTRKLAQLEQDGINALQQFEYQEIEALLQAMNAAEGLGQLKGGSAQLLRHYTPHSPPWVLQQILDRIRQKNQFSNNETASRDPYATAVFSPNRQELVVTRNDGTINLTTPEGDIIQTFDGHFAEVEQAEISPDGEQIATASEDGLFRIWQRDGSLAHTIEHPAKSSGRIRFSPNDEYIGISAWEQDDIILLDTNGDYIRTIKSFSVNDLAFSPDGQTIASISDNNTVQLFDLKGQEIGVLEGHTRAVVGVKFSPDGQYLLTGSADHTVRLWNLETDEPVVISNLQGWVEAVDFHPNGDQIAVGSSGGLVQVFDLQGTLVRRFSGHSGSVDSVSFSADGTTLATASDDGNIRIWSLADKAIADLDGHTDGVWDTSFSPDGLQLATASYDGTTRIWDLTGKEVGRLTLPDQAFQEVVYSPDNNIIATSTHQGKIQIWDLNGDLIDNFEIHKAWTFGLDISSKGNYLVSGSTDGTAKVWDLEGQVLSTVEHDYWIRDVEFSPDGQMFVTAYENSLARLWNLDGTLLADLVGHADSVNSIRFSPGGTKIVTVSDDSTVKLWNLQGNLLSSFQKHHGRVWTVAFSPDGESLITGTSDGYARHWDLQGNLIGEFKGHNAMVSSVELSPSGQYLVTASVDGTAKIWNIAQTLDDLLDQGCAWLEDYLILHPERLIELEACHSEPVLAKAASSLVKQGDLLAKADNQQEAISTYQIAKAWNSDFDFKPETRVKQFMGIQEAEVLAKNGKIDAALTTFQNAVDLDTNLDLNPEQTVNYIAVHTLVKQGISLAQEGNATAAETAFQKALELDQSLPFDPKARSRHLAAIALVGKGEQFIREGKIEQALTAFTKAQEEVNPDVAIPTGILNDLCWQGSLLGQAKKVLESCDQAVQLAPQDPDIRDSRGLARALTGDFEGAISDFEFFVKHFEQTTDEQTMLKRQQWIKQLQSGKNPFTPEVLDSL